MQAAAQVQQGLVRIGARQPDLNERFLKFAADFFGTLAKGERPPKPDRMIAEITATVVAQTVGAEVPMPLGDPIKRQYKKRNAPADTAEVPKGLIAENPNARAILEAHGTKPSHIYIKSRLVVSVFLNYPDRWWKTKEVCEKVGHRTQRGSVNAILRRMAEAGILIREGARTSCRWKRAEMPPHV